MADRPRDPWFTLAGRTPARIALGRAGSALPTKAVLAFGLAHAQARDAVHAKFDRASLAAQLGTMGLASVEVESEASDGQIDRQLYLRRPDLGRRLSTASREQLGRLGEEASFDLLIVIGDGLSAAAVGSHAPTLIAEFLPLAARLGLRLGPAILASGARVALGDEIGAALKARAVAVLIGERPGLSAANSLGVYLTYDPRPGRHDAERNCISNVRPDGLPPALAARKLAWLVEAAFVRRLTGVALKDESDALLAEPGGPLGLGGSR